MNTWKKANKWIKCILFLSHPSENLAMKQNKMVKTHIISSVGTKPVHYLAALKSSVKANLFEEQPMSPFHSCSTAYSKSFWEYFLK